MSPFLLHNTEMKGRGGDKAIYNLKLFGVLFFYICVLLVISVLPQAHRLSCSNLLYYFTNQVRYCFLNLSGTCILQVNTPRICTRLIWAISEHIDLEGLDPLLADDPEDPLNIIISNIHKVLFNIDSSASNTNRLQDVQAVLLCAQRLGSRNPRAGQLLIKELEEFRTNALADSVNKHQCRLILQRIKYVTNHSESK